MAILKSLVAAPILICGAVICSPVSAETAVNDITPVLSPAAKKALQKLRFERPNMPIVVEHRFNLNGFHKVGCEGSIKNGCNVKNRILFNGF